MSRDSLILMARHTSPRGSPGSRPKVAPARLPSLLMDDLMVTTQNDPSWLHKVQEVAKAAATSRPAPGLVKLVTPFFLSKPLPLEVADESHCPVRPGVGSSVVVHHLGSTATSREPWTSGPKRPSDRQRGRTQRSP